jgi:hypothetical protein
MSTVARPKRTGISANTARPENITETIPSWKKHGMEDIYFQREAQMSFWTVLGGLAMAALLTQLPALWQEILKSRWHLVMYLIASVFVVATSWVQTSWGSLVLKWPISIITTVVMLFQMLVQSVQCLLIIKPAGWMAATAGILLAALANQFYFSKSGSWVAFSERYVKRFRQSNLIYFLLMLICIGAALQMYLLPWSPSEIIWGIFALIFSTFALVLQHGSMKKEREELGVP